MSSVCMRFSDSLRWGFAVWILLVPVLFCPWPASRQSLYERLGRPNRIVQASIALVVAVSLAVVLTSRLRLRGRGLVRCTDASLESGMDLAERADCMGILLPLAANVYALYNFTHPRRGDYLFRRSMNPETIVSLGILGLGIALFLHAIGFVPYKRVPFLRYALAAGGVALFIYGATCRASVT